MALEPKLTVSAGVTPKVASDTPSVATPVVAIVEKAAIKNQSAVVVAENTFETAMPARASDVSRLPLPAFMIGARRDAGGKLENAGPPRALASVAANIVGDDADLALPPKDMPAALTNNITGYRFKSPEARMRAEDRIIHSGPVESAPREEELQAIANTDFRLSTNADGTVSIGDQRVNELQRAERSETILRNGAMTRDGRIIQVSPEALKEYYDRKDALLSSGPDITVVGRKWITHDTQRRAQAYAVEAQQVARESAQQELALGDASSVSPSGKSEGAREAEAMQRKADQLGKSTARNATARVTEDSVRREGLKRQIEASMVAHQLEDRNRAKA